MKLASRISRCSYAFALFAVLALQTSAFAQDKAVKIDQMISLYHKYDQFNGSALVVDNGKVIYKKGVGLANMEWDIPNAPDTKFRLGSITKQFTATLILQLVEQGKIRLDGKLIDYLPDYRKDTGAKVTIHNLLSHTSGIPSYTSLPGFFQDVSRNPFKVDDFIKKYASGDLEFEPGTKFVYDNSGYFLLGAIVEKVTGKPYEKVLKENIFDPLGMKNSGYDHWGTILSKRATGYTRSARGFQTAAYLDMSIPYAAGSLYSTVEDLYLWDQALYGEKILSAKSKDLMFKPNLNNYGYGFVITKATLAPPTKLAVPVIQHNGGINGFNTVIVRMTNDKRLIVLLDNAEDGQYLDKITLGIMSVLYDQPYDMPKRSIADAILYTITERDVASAITQYRALKAGPTASEYDFGETELNRLGYQLLSMKKVAEAIEVFKLNVETYPQSANVYDSLGEAYMAHNDKELSIANYKKSLELDPNNGNAKSRLASLTGDQGVKVDPKIYDSYVGEYQLGPTFTITITSEDGKLMAQATGQSKFELFPTSETDFYLKVVPATVTFVKDARGKVTELILTQSGRKGTATKIR